MGSADSLPGCRWLTPFLGTAALVMALGVDAPLVAQMSGTGSTVPCVAPQAWSIDAIDPRSGLRREGAVRAAEDAAALWERAVGTSLFDIVPEGGSAIRFEFDDRQVTLGARGDRVAEVEEGRREVGTRRAEVVAASRQLESAFDAFNRDSEEHGRVLQTYNDDVARWNREAEVPPSVEEELAARRASIDSVAADLERRLEELNRRANRIRSDVEAFNRQVEALSRQEAALSRDFPATAAESGRYDEVIVREGNRVVSVTRRIRVYQFTDHTDLVQVLAHEFGHALGLGHATSDGAIMSAVSTTGVDLTASGRVTDVDREMLRRLCPGRRR